MNALGLLPPRARRRVKDHFTYNITFNTIAASATSVGTSNIQGDSDFWWVAGSVVITNAAGTTFTGSGVAPFLIELSDSSSGRNLQDSATHISNLFGTAQLPFYLPFPREFKASGQISAKLQNQDSGNAFVVRLALHGFKLFAANEPTDAQIMAGAPAGSP